MIEMYKQGLSSSQIATKLGCAGSSVSRRLKKVGIKLRTSSDYDKEKRYWLWKGENYLPENIRKYNQLKFRKWSLAVRNRDGNKCIDCGITKVKLHAHHLIPLKECMNTQLEYDVNNGVTLCIRCHKNRHKK